MKEVDADFSRVAAVSERYSMATETLMQLFISGVIITERQL
jgi:hypothetical protein